MSKKNENNLDRLCEFIANEVGRGATRESARRYLIAIYKIILNQLKFNGKVQFSKFGTFELYEREGKEMKVGNPYEGGVKYIYAPQKYFVNFKMANGLDRCINDFDFKFKNKNKPIKEKKKKIKYKDDVDKKRRGRLPKRFWVNPPMDSTLADMLNQANERSKE